MSRSVRRRSRVCDFMVQAASDFVTLYQIVNQQSTCCCTRTVAVLNFAALVMDLTLPFVFAAHSYTSRCTLRVIPYCFVRFSARALDSPWAACLPWGSLPSHCCGARPYSRPTIRDEMLRESEPEQTLACLSQFDSCLYDRVCVMDMFELALPVLSFFKELITQKHYQKIAALFSY
jgi:hypothetical protein